MLGWLVAIVLVGYAIARVGAGYPRAEGTWRVLDRREVAFLNAAAEALFPRGGAIEPSGADAGIPAYVDRFLAAARPRQRVLMRLLFFLVEHATIFFPAPGGLRGLQRFSSLDFEQRVAAIEGWQRSALFPRRLVFTSLRAIFALGYFSHPPVLRALRLAPYAIDTPVCEADLWYPRIGEHPDAIPWTTADLTAPSQGVPLDLDGPLMPRFAEERS
jgi:hypothetical protein